jgi:protein-disulfide isomerase
MNTLLTNPRRAVPGARLALLCLLLPLSAFAQSSSTLKVAIAPALDKVKLEAYLRHLEVWPAMINVKIDDPKPSADMPGFNKVIVHLSYNDARMDQAYFVTNDGQKIFKGEAYDLNKSPFQANLDKIKTDHQPSFGAAADAPVNLVVFGDFECPYCKEEASVLRQNIPAMFAGKVRVYFMDFPLESIHPWSRVAAIAGRCVLKQGEDAFWKYHDWIYDKQTDITPDNYNAKLMEWAGQGGVDPVQLGRCVESKATDAEVTRTQEMGRTLGVDGTPTLYLNGRKVMDQMAQWPTLQQIIALEIDNQAKVKEDAEKCCVLEIPKIVK